MAKTKWTTKASAFGEGAGGESVTVSVSLKIEYAKRPEAELNALDYFLLLSLSGKRMGVEEGREINRIKKGAEKQVRRARQHVGKLELGLVKMVKGL